MTDTTTDVVLPSEEQAADIARAADDAANDALPEGMPVSDLVLWAFEARQAHAIAVSLAATSFVPTSLRGKPGDITAAILTGQEIGLKPMAALRSLDIVNGTPALRAHAMRALLQSHGHEIEVVESDAEHCVMRGRRFMGHQLGVRQYGGWQSVTWTMARAQKMGLASKSTWQNMPEEMLLARATSQLSRLIAADVIHAVPYAAEELSDGGLDQPVQARVSVAELVGSLANEAKPEKAPQEPPAVVDGPRADLDEQEAEVVADEQLSHDVEPEPRVAEVEHAMDVAAEAETHEREQSRRASPRQKGTIHMLFGQLGFTPEGDAEERAEYLAELSAMVNRDVTSSNQLSSAEASLVIQLLERKLAQAPE